MPSRKNWNKRPPQAIAEHKFVHFRNISYGCSKERFAQLLSSQGYNNCIVYWPNEQKSNEHSHRGFCQVQFPDAAIAARAKTTFAGYSIAGRLMKTADIIPPPPRQNRLSARSQPVQQPAPLAPVLTSAPRTRSAHPSQGGLNQFRQVEESLQSIASPSSPFPSSLAAPSSDAAQSADTNAAPTLVSTSPVSPAIPTPDCPAPLPTSDASGVVPSSME